MKVMRTGREEIGHIESKSIIEIKLDKNKKASTIVHANTLLVTES